MYEESFSLSGGLFCFCMLCGNFVYIVTMTTKRLKIYTFTRFYSHPLSWNFSNPSHFKQWVSSTDTGLMLEFNQSHWSIDWRWHSRLRTLLMMRFSTRPILAQIMATFMASNNQRQFACILMICRPGPNHNQQWDPPRPITALVNANGSQQCGTIAGTQPTVCCAYTQHTLAQG